jgi:hypothetical protein
MSLLQDTCNLSFIQEKIANGRMKKACGNILSGILHGMSRGDILVLFISSLLLNFCVSIGGFYAHSGG